MKKIIFMMFAVCVILFATNAFAGDLISVAWDINDLIDDQGDPIIGMILDIEPGVYVLAIHGVVLFDEGVAGCDGSGLFGENAFYLYLNLQSYPLFVTINLPSANGTINLYNSRQQLIDSGTVTLKWIE